MPAITSLSIAVLRHLMRLVQALKNRRKANLLTRLDDRMLADIGLTRSDVRDAYLGLGHTQTLSGTAQRWTRRKTWR